MQFLPAYNALLEEALREALVTLYATTTTRVLRLEHLLAVCVQTGRGKEREQVRMLREQAKIDHSYLLEILRRYHLEDTWKIRTN